MICKKIWRFFNENFSRIRVQLEKADKVEDTKNIITHGKLKLDPSQLECEWNGKALPDKLTTTEFLIVKN